MNSARFNRQANAFTLVEMLVVVGIIAILAALLLPALERSKARARRIECVGNLKEAGLAFHVFANDHNGRLPAQVSTNDGGALEYVEAGDQLRNTCFYFGYQYIRPLAPILQTPKLLVCPADSLRWAATNFDDFNNVNLSYDVGVVGDTGNPRLILAADDEIPALASACTILHVPLPENLPARWMSGHGSAGNLLFADGHVELSSDATVRSQMSLAEDFVKPSLKPAARSPGITAPAGDGGTGPTGRPKESSTPGATSPNKSNLPADPASPGATDLLHATNNSNAAFNQPAHVAPVVSPGRVSDDSRAQDSVHAEFTNAVAENVVGTNLPGAAVAPAADDDSLMSPFDRQLVKFLRDVIIGAYLLILFLLLLFVAYRVWRHFNDPERQRRRRNR